MPITVVYQKAHKYQHIYKSLSMSDLSWVGDFTVYEDNNEFEIYYKKKLRKVTHIQANHWMLT